MLRIAIAFLLGHCLTFACHQLPASAVMAALAFGLLALAWLTRVAALAAFVVGALLAAHAVHAGLEHDLQPSLEGEDIVVQGEIISIPEATDRGVQFDLELQAAAKGLPRIARLTWFDTTQAPQAGETWQLCVRLKRRHGFANEGGFDYEGSLFRAGIGATGYARASDDNRRLQPATFGSSLLQWRAHLASVIARATHGDPFTGVLQGLAVGVQSGMTTEQWRVFARTGTTHLMAISGFHIGMVAAVCAWLCGRLCVRICPQHWGVTALQGRALGGIAGALAYSALAGMSVPTQRTLVMLCLYLLARALRRPLAVTHAMALAVILVLFVDPFAPLAPGAWLSFLAVAAILLVSLGRTSPSRSMLEHARVQWAVTIGLLPVVIAAFGGVSLVGPLANAVAIPVFTFLLVPLVLLGTAVATVSIEAGGAVLQLPLWILDGLWRVLEPLAASSLATWHAPDMAPWALGLCAIGAVGLLIPSIWPVRLAACSLCLPALLNGPRVPAEMEARFTLLDVGQGLSAVVQTRHHILVYDTGPLFRSGRDTSELVVLPYLYSQGIHRVDVLMISHSDADHAGGLRSFLRDMPTAQLLHGPSLRQRGHSKVCARGQHWQWDGVQFEVLHPRPGDHWSDNDSSCVLRISAGAHSAVLAGDIESAGEAAVAGDLRNTDIVVVPHHGSRTSSTADFVAHTRPSYALVSAGYRNRWGFPKREVVDRWQAVGAHVLTTADTGAIDLLLTRQGIGAARAYRDAHRRVWSWQPQTAQDGAP